MIFIVSRNSDVSTNRVIKWLLAERIPFERINFSDFFSNPETISLKITSEGRRLQLRGKQYKEQELKKSVIWYRKLERSSSVEHFKRLATQYPGISNHISREFDAFTRAVTSFFYDSYWLCNYMSGQLNKSLVLIHAQQCGLKIPPTIISNHKKALFHFSNKEKITKCIGDGLSVEFPDQKRYLLSTNKISDSEMASLPEYFFPSTLQSYIEKSIELRIFFVGDQFFASAIFSQDSEITKTDFRLNVIDNLPCRMVPYNLPASLEQNLKKLMNRIGLNTGSIDMIVTPNQEYYFLEVNPFGQYGWVADLCNYPIDKAIATFLKKQHDEREHTSVDC